MSAVSSSFSQRRFNVQGAAGSPVADASPGASELAPLLDRTEEILQENPADSEAVGQAVHGLFSGLFTARANSTSDEWQDCIKRCREHRVLDLIHEDPFTFRAFRKPRGYAGDAELLDLIYGPEEHWPLPEASPRGMNIYRYTSAAPAAEGVRARRGFIADLIDRISTNEPGKHILAVAAGHLREACLTSAVRRRRIGRFVALDSDPLSGRTAATEWKPCRRRSAI
jgi:extracellular factor (EF) 3-hydroxypalmitic acid methyl ester biosynthesis protein